MSNSGKPNNPIPPHQVLKMTLNNIFMSLYYGNIFMVDSDILVNPANELMEHTGGLALKISEAAGPKLKDECKKWVQSHGEIPPGKVAITPSFNLSSRYRGIIHTVGPKGKDEPYPSESDENLLISAVFESFKTANKEKMTTISLPAISTGIFNYNPEFAAKNHLEAFLVYAGQYRVYYPEGTLNEIKLVISKRDILEEFIKKFCSERETFDIFDYFGLPEEVGSGALYSYCELCERPQTLIFFELSSKCCIRLCDFCIHDNQIEICAICSKPLPFNSMLKKNNFICRTCKKETKRTNICPCLESIPY